MDCQCYQEVDEDALNGRKCCARVQQQQEHALRGRSCPFVCATAQDLFRIWWKLSQRRILRTVGGEWMMQREYDWLLASLLVSTFLMVRVATRALSCLKINLAFGAQSGSACLVDSSSHG
jgi:hypothetical protein